MEDRKQQPFHSQSSLLSGGGEPVQHRNICLPLSLSDPQLANYQGLLENQWQVKDR